MQVEYCNYGGCDAIGTEPFIHRFLCKKHAKEIQDKDLSVIRGKPIPEDRKHHLCGYRSCNSYAVYEVQVENPRPEDSLFESHRMTKPVCACHLFVDFVSSDGQIKRSRHIEQTKEAKKEKEKLELEDEKTESILFE